MKRHSQICAAVALIIALTILNSSADAQSSDDEWFPWAYTVDLNDSTISDSMTAAEGLRKLKATELWSAAGERLILELVASDTFDEALSQFGDFVTTKPRDARLAASHGMLLTYAAYMSESDREIDRLSTEADRAFDRASKLDPNNWEAWIGKAALYGYSEEAQYEKAAVQLLLPTIQAQEQDRRHPKYAYAYLVLGDIYTGLEQPEKAKQTWQRGLRFFPRNATLKAKLTKRPTASKRPDDRTQRPAGSGITDEVSYTNDIRPIVKNFCTTCHAGDDPEGDFVLTSYSDVRKYTEKGKLLARINDMKKPMPQDGLLPQHMRRLFQLWANSGYVNQGTTKGSTAREQYAKFTPPTITPVDINKQGFDLLENMQGHWVGPMHLLGQDYDWWAFDFRPIAPSHVHGIFEGGTIGNLFTSFFVTNFKGKRTIMARNGGILNGIYRTTYFVLDEVKYGRDWAYYRLVDAYGGAGIMRMELTFQGNGLEFKAYTSRFGLTEPKLHMSFTGERKRPEIAAAAAKAVGFPKNVVDFEFTNGLPTPTWVDEYPQTSATYLAEAAGKSLIELARLAKDPRRIDQMPHLSKLTVSVERNASTTGKKLHVYLSQKALADEDGRFIKQDGYVRLDLLDTLLSFPELGKGTDEFTFTYLHPGDYFLTVIADMDADGYPSPGDITHPRTKITIAPEDHERITIKGLTVRN